MKKNIQSAPFRLLRWFGWLSFLAIVAIAVAQATLMQKFLSAHLFQREGELSRDFIQNILVADGSLGHLSNPEDEYLASRFNGTVAHFKNMNDVLRATVYDTHGTVIWSSQDMLIGRKSDEDNDELEEALQGVLVINPAHISEWVMEKKEHIGLDPAIQYFVECYIPVFDPATKKVIGVVEFYKATAAMTEAIEEGKKQVWLLALASAFLLYGSLYWVVRRADRTIKKQYERLVETETLAVVGELTSSIAHNIRNPLSSIRSSAELALESPGENCSEQAKDIVREVDRIGKQITELLNFSAEYSGETVCVDVGKLLDQSVTEHLATFNGRGQELLLSIDVTDPHLTADEVMLKQAVHSLLSNASEAMENRGRCKISLKEGADSGLILEIEDEGRGIPAAVKKQIFRPFFTTKPKGMGLGLPQARKIIQRFGGELQIEDADVQGTIVKIKFPRS